MSVWAFIMLPALLFAWVDRWLDAHRAAADFLEADAAMWEAHQALGVEQIAADVA